MHRLFAFIASGAGLNRKFVLAVCMNRARRRTLVPDPAAEAGVGADGSELALLAPADAAAGSMLLGSIPCICWHALTGVGFTGCTWMAAGLSQPSGVEPSHHDAGAL